MTESELNNDIDDLLDELAAEQAAFIAEMDRILNMLKNADAEDLSRGDFERLREDFQERREWKRDLNDRLMDLAERVAASEAERPGGLDDEAAAEGTDGDGE